LIVAGQISEPQPLSPIQERSFAESPSSVTLPSACMIYSFSFTPLFTMYFYYLHIWPIFSDYGTQNFEDTREHITEEPEEEVDYEPSPDHTYIEEPMEEPVDDIIEGPFEEPEEVIEDPIVQGTCTSFYVLLL